MASIFDTTLSGELSDYTLSLVSMISKQFSLNVDDLLHVVSTHQNNPQSTAIVEQPVKRVRRIPRHFQRIQLEYTIIKGHEYLYDPYTTRVFSFGTETPILLGKYSVEDDCIITCLQETS